MKIVVDASAAVEVALGRELAHGFRRVLGDASLVIAPDFYAAEVTNVFWKYGHLSGLPADACAASVAFCLRVVDDYIRTRDLTSEVLSESLRLKHSAYDVFYLVVARRNDAAILTRDTRMIKAAKAIGVSIAP